MPTEGESGIETSGNLWTVDVPGTRTSPIGEPRSEVVFLEIRIVRERLAERDDAVRRPFQTPVTSEVLSQPVETH